MSKINYLLLAGAILVASAIAIVSFNPKRPSASDYERTVSHAIAPTEDTILKAAIAAGVATHPGQSGFALFTRGDESLMLRLAMIEAAQRTLDIQYYIIQDDVTGKLFLEALLRAADRGVRVRVLMDDLNLHGRDSTWPLLNIHRNIEIRVFNPFATRDEPLFTRLSDVFTGIGQFSKRMHNKILIADNQLAITGGRNIGDEYFGAGGDFNFRDVDVLAVGLIVARLSESFDKYWNNDESFPIAALHKPADAAAAIKKLREELHRHWQEETEKGTIAKQAPLAARLENGQIPLLWAEVELAVDAPSKIDLPETMVSSNPAKNLNAMAGQAEREFIIVSPYFVPGDGGMQGLKGLVQRGVKVRVLTNSLASTDAVAAHTGYRHYREALVEDGVDLYEMQPIAGSHPHSRRFSSAARNSLHSKIYIADRQDVVIGSFNLDPRSMSLNTEITLLIHSPELAGQLAAMFEKAIAPAAAFHLVMQGQHVEWNCEKNGQEQHYGSEPEAGFWRNIKADLFALLPLENQL